MTDNQSHKRGALAIVARGIGMGAADVVPGVSGGTVALITGIYERLLFALGAFGRGTWQAGRERGWRGVWQQTDLGFLLALGAGIAVGLLSLGQLVHWLLEHHPLPVWAAFFGLILASVPMVTAQMRTYRPAHLLLGLIGAAIALAITLMRPAETPDALWFVAVSGCIAISAMVLPGISGSFLLLLLGKYEFMLAALTGFDVPVIIVFMFGAAVGLFSVVQLLNKLLKRAHDATLATLAGFMLGSLNALWPWRVDVVGAGEEVRRSVSPSRFESITGEPAQIGLVLTTFVLAMLLVLGLHWLGQRLTRKSTQA